MSTSSNQPSTSSPKNGPQRPKNDPGPPKTGENGSEFPYAHLTTSQNLAILREKHMVMYYDCQRLTKENVKLSNQVIAANMERDSIMMWAEEQVAREKKKREEVEEELELWKKGVYIHPDHVTKAALGYGAQFFSPKNGPQRPKNDPGPPKTGENGSEFPYAHLTTSQNLAILREKHMVMYYDCQRLTKENVKLSNQVIAANMERDSIMMWAEEQVAREKKKREEVEEELELWKKGVYIHPDHVTKAALGYGAQFLESRQYAPNPSVGSAGRSSSFSVPKHSESRLSAPTFPNTSGPRAPKASSLGPSAPRSLAPGPSTQAEPTPEPNKDYDDTTVTLSLVSRMGDYLDTEFNEDQFLTDIGALGSVESTKAKTPNVDVNANKVPKRKRRTAQEVKARKEAKEDQGSKSIKDSNAKKPKVKRAARRKIEHGQAAAQTAPDRTPTGPSNPVSFADRYAPNGALGGQIPNVYPYLDDFVGFFAQNGPQNPVNPPGSQVQYGASTSASLVGYHAETSPTHTNNLRGYVPSGPSSSTTSAHSAPFDPQYLKHQGPITSRGYQQVTTVVQTTRPLDPLAFQNDFCDLETWRMNSKQA